MIRVLLVDDHELVRTGIKRLLEDVTDIEVVGEAARGEEAMERIAECGPDVVLMDVNMPGMGGLEATRKLLRKDPDLRIIILTILSEEPYPRNLLEAGAAGYLTKGCGMDEMIRAIRQVAAGRPYLAGEVATQVAMGGLRHGEGGGSPFQSLSQRETQVMQLLIRGEGVQAISDHLCISPKTVSTYRHRLLEKLGVDNVVALTRLAMRHGVIDEHSGT